MHVLELACPNQQTQFSPAGHRGLSFYFGSEVFCIQGGIRRDQSCISLHLDHSANES